MKLLAWPEAWAARKSPSQSAPPPELPPFVGNLPFDSGELTVFLPEVLDERLELVGACYDPTCVLVTVGFKQPVDYTVINGHVTVEKGHIVGLDEEKLVRDAEQEVKRYLGR